GSDEDVCINAVVRIGHGRIGRLAPGWANQLRSAPGSIRQDIKYSGGADRSAASAAAEKTGSLRHRRRPEDSCGGRRSWVDLSVEYRVSFGRPHSGYRTDWTTYYHP